MGKCCCRHIWCLTMFPKSLCSVNHDETVLQEWLEHYLTEWVQHFCSIDDGALTALTRSRNLTAL